MRALEMALWRRKGDVEGLVHHSDRGAQYLSIRYTERPAEAGAVTSVGSRGDSYDNALAESVIGLYKTELIRKQGPWKTLQDVEFATLEWVDSFNHRRLFEGIGNIPPAETEEICYATLTAEEEEGHGANEPPVNPGRFSKCILAIYTYLIISFMLCVITTNHFASLSVMVLSPLPHVMSLFRHPLFFPTSAHIKALHAFNL